MSMADAPWWLSVVTGASGAVVGFGFAVKMAQYQAALDKHRAERQAAMALRVDLARLVANLGHSVEQFGDGRKGQALTLPSVHRWSEPIIAQLAVADPLIIAECMRLDEVLKTFADAVSRLREHTQTMTVEQGWEDVFNPDPDSPGRRSARAAHEGRLIAAAKAIADATDDAQEISDFAKTTLDGLVRRVSAIAYRAEPAFMELEDERETRILRSFARSLVRVSATAPSSRSNRDRP
jgi:hypothetical protein